MHQRCDKFECTLKVNAYVFLLCYKMKRDSCICKERRKRKCLIIEEMLADWFNISRFLLNQAAGWLVNSCRLGSYRRHFTLPMSEYHKAETYRSSGIFFCQY